MGTLAGDVELLTGSTGVGARQGLTLVLMSYYRDKWFSLLGHQQYTHKKSTEEIFLFVVQHRITLIRLKIDNSEDKGSYLFEVFK